MASDPETLRAQIARYQAKATDLRQRAEQFAGERVAAVFALIARNYDEMAAQLEAIVRRHYQ